MLTGTLERLEVRSGSFGLEDEANLSVDLSVALCRAKGQVGDEGIGDGLTSSFVRDDKATGVMAPGSMMATKPKVPPLE